ncbi:MULTISPECIES: type IV pilus modification protein PilV [Cupriavidus]|jgi:type IV pilus assembly protein PilV|uniref:Type IV pilus modification protein PilV n=1 Tax=Cupriavidus pauculus TaxID=82633 RepID=A0A5P2H3F1_9BURK|nr:type IV pilus modification protein PilV [Cupriavidus pauculus]QET02531.1 type IV pilus modification protein PilV [Cupriavidus pauculus]
MSRHPSHAQRSGRVPRIRARRPAPRNAAGFSLIEALVTIVILSFGVLALAMLQVQTLVDTRTSAARNIAAEMAYNLADEIRSNNAAYDLGAFKTLPTDPPAQVAACYGAGCTPAQMATTSYATWRNDLGSALPQGKGYVCVDGSPDDGESPADNQCDNAPGAPYVIKIWWNEDQGSALRFVTSFVPFPVAAGTP